MLSITQIIYPIPPAAGHGGFLIPGRLCDVMGRQHPGPFQPVHCELGHLEDARRLVEGYVEHYNNVRLNTATGYITPKDMLAGGSRGSTPSATGSSKRPGASVKHVGAQHDHNGLALVGLLQVVNHTVRNSGQAPAGGLDSRSLR